MTKEELAHIHQFFMDSFFPQKTFEQIKEDERLFFCGAHWDQLEIEREYIAGGCLF